MPQLEDVEYYLRGLWLVIRGKRDGFLWLDMSERGFWRSWGAIFFCLPPMLLGWAGLRVYYLATMPVGVSAGPSFVFKLFWVDASSWVVSYSALVLAMRLTGYAARIRPMMIAINWLTVPVQWAFAPLSLVEIMAPLNSDLQMALTLPMLLLVGFVHLRVMIPLVDGKILPGATFFLTMTISSYMATSLTASAFGIFTGS
jgi:hypothetical protein